MYKSKHQGIAQLGEKVLRKKAKKVKNIFDNEIQKLIQDMLKSVAKNGGVGLAAPQIFHSLQIMIIASKPNDRYPTAPYRLPFVLINPKVIKESKSKEKDWEGCLSIPGIRGLVPRHQKIEVEYTDRYGNLVNQQLTDFVARIFQHEYDHFEGLVFLDRVESTFDIVTEQEYQNLIIDKL